jgi:glycosyltransferase involved in cell wall biosynthesis
MPIFLRRLGLLRRGQRMVMYHNGETLYYLKTGYYGRVSKWLLSLSFKSFHANIVLGDMGVELYQALFGNEGPPCYKSFTGTPAETLNRFGQVQPALNSRSLLFIGQGPSGFRSHYKGLDILLESFERIGSTCAEAQLYIIGEWDEAVKQHLLSAHCPRTASRVFFLGAMKQEDMLNWMSSSAVYLHPARGEAFGTVVTDAMAAGLVPVVSEWTGAKEAVLQVDASLVVPLTPQAMAERVLQLFDAPVSELEGLSTRARKVGSQYTLENGLDKFLNTFHNILRSFDQN